MFLFVELEQDRLVAKMRELNLRPVEIAPRKEVLDRIKSKLGKRAVQAVVLLRGGYAHNYTTVYSYFVKRLIGYILKVPLRTRSTGPN